MSKKNKLIPVNTMTDGFGGGIVLERISFKEFHTQEKAVIKTAEEAYQSHRHDRHSFFLLEKGTVQIEIDFEKYKIIAPSLLYMHPDRVHRTTALENITVSSLAINDENLDPEHIKLLEGLKSVKPLVLKNEMFAVICETLFLCLKFSERKSDRLYNSLLKHSCNALVALVVSQYLQESALRGKLSRFEIVTKAFKEILESNYATCRSPAMYAQKLNISAAYLNECIKNTTGHSVSHHIQQRIILEAKRLLCYSDKSVKEIAAALGYDDYPYFSRLFTKVAGITALAFRNKNHD